MHISTLNTLTTCIHCSTLFPSALCCDIDLASIDDLSRQLRADPGRHSDGGTVDAAGVVTFVALSHGLRNEVNDPKLPAFSADFSRPFRERMCKAA